MKPCRNGHTAERNKHGGCKECAKEAMRRYRSKPENLAKAKKRRQEYESTPEGLEKRRALQRKWSAENRERKNQALREWRVKNPGKAAAYNKKWRKANPKKFAACRQKWREDNPEYYREKSRRDQAARRGSQPKWVCRETLKQIYKNCPDGQQVDHIIPINGKNVCGLHVPENLQYLTADENKRKGNSF